MPRGLLKKDTQKYCNKKNTDQLSADGVKEPKDNNKVPLKHDLFQIIKHHFSNTLIPHCTFFHLQYC